MLSALMRVLVTLFFRIPARIRDRLYTSWLARRRNVTLAGKTVIHGLPLIDIRDGASLQIGAAVMLNSRNRGYHINMHSPVKLMADRPGARIRIGDRTRIHGSCVHAYESITIGRNCLIAANCQIFDGNGHDLSFPNVQDRINTAGSAKPISIEDNVWIGANSVVLPGVTIGEGSVISANSVVASNIPPFVVAGGNPATIIRQYARE